MAKAQTVADNQTTSPRWAGDFLTPDRLIPGGARVDQAQFFASDSVNVEVAVAGAAQNAVSVPVDALSGPIPSGTTLHFGTNKFATLSAPALTGDTHLTVLAIPTALVDDDMARYPGTLKHSIPSGFVLGRTIAERDAGIGYGPAVSSDDEIFLVAFEVVDMVNNPDVDLYRHNGMVKENFLPGFSALDPAVVTLLRAAYACTKGVA